MEYLEGTPIQGSLPAEEAVRVALEIDGALEPARSQGIFHRDLKPGNILITRAGLRLLDFGLAKLSPASNSGDETPTQTNAGTILRTAAYMWPEQAEGQPVDARSGIFSFGIVLYEVLSGRRAFTGENSLSTMAAILYKEPEAFHAPRDIARIVVRCLRKSPAGRFQNHGAGQDRAGADLIQMR